MNNGSSGQRSDMGGSMGGGSGGSTRRPSGATRRPTSTPAQPPLSDREVDLDLSQYPRYVADTGRHVAGEPSLECAECGQTAYELFHGRCMPCAIRAEIPLRQKDREAYAARVRAGMDAPAIRHVRPARSPRLRWWQWRRWWPWASRRRATDRKRGL